MALALWGLAFPASAGHCWGPSTSEAIAVRTPADVADSGRPPDEEGWWTYYLATDPCDQTVAGTACLPGLTGVYVESNGIDGLQRQDNAVDNTCHGMIVPDAMT